MTMLTRFSVSLEKALLEAFDCQVRAEHYPTRSKAVGDLIRHSLVRKACKGNTEAVGSIVLVYDPRRSGLTSRLNSIQHEFHHLVIATQHVHLDHDNCLEILAVRGKPADLETLERKLRTAKGVKHGGLVIAASGRSTP